MAGDQQTAEQIYCFRKSTRESKVVGPGLRVVGIWVNLWIILGVVGMPQLFPRENDATPSLVPLCAAAVLSLLVLAWVKHRGLDRSLPAAEPGRGDRLSLAGRSYHPAHTAESAGSGPSPLTFSTVIALKFTTAMTVATVLLIAMATPLLLAIDWFVLCPFASWDVHWFLVSVLVAVLLASWGACFVVGWLCPASFQIAPRLLEVTRLNRITGRRLNVGHYDLRNARILVDQVRGIVFLDEPGGRRTDFYTSWMLPRKKGRFVSRLLLAALSSNQAPDHPDDKLLG